MRSSLPKALHKLAGRSMLAHVLDAVGQAGADALAVVVGPGREDVAAEVLRVAPDAKIFVQAERLGTAHAVLAAREAFQGFDDILVLFADTPLVRPETFAALRAKLAGGAGVAALGFEAENPFGYGRLLTDEAGALVAIREHKDASPDELQVRRCNAGLMALDGRRALDWLYAGRRRQRPAGILFARRGGDRPRRWRFLRAGDRPGRRSARGQRPCAACAGRGRDPDPAAPGRHGGRRHPDRAGDGVLQP